MCSATPVTDNKENGKETFSSLKILNLFYLHPIIGVFQILLNCC